uniref:Uncharacterized protein MANES_05G075900 n=1 Tax=Rhizophora mucronata TaxID=61149 RepID=A0A2P2IZV6_RHIMU
MICKYLEFFFLIFFPLYSIFPEFPSSADVFKIGKLPIGLAKEAKKQNSNHNSLPNQHT